MNNMGFSNKDNKKKETIAPKKNTKKTSEVKTRKKNAKVSRKDFHAAAMKELKNTAERNRTPQQSSTAAAVRAYKDSKKTDAEKDPQKAAVNRKLKKLKIFAAVFFSLIFASAASLYAYGCMTIPVDTIAKNVYIEGIDVSGLTQQEAINKLRSADLLSNKRITLKCNNQAYTLTGADAGLSAKLEDTVSKAVKYGKDGNIFHNGFLNAVQLVYPRNIVPDATIDADLLNSRLAEFGKQLYGELTEHGFWAQDGFVTCTPGHSGFDGNTQKAFDEVIKAIGNKNFDINVSLNKAAPKEWTVEELAELVNCQPADAYYDQLDGDVIVVDEIYGKTIDEAAARAPLSELREGGDIILIPYISQEPAIKGADLREKLFRDIIGSYSTSYGSSTANRCANIATAAGKIAGKTLMPGEVFSFNDTVGSRSAANGFYSAQEYMDGQTVEGIGGGTCQVSSTLYNAVLYADLSVVSRTNHMFPVSYCPIGQDATVADTGVDFKFVNSMDYPIKISAYTEGYTVTVSILGTQRDDPRTVKIENTETAVGKDKSVHSVRYVYNSAGTLIQTDDLGNSYYMEHKQQN